MVFGLTNSVARNPEPFVTAMPNDPFNDLTDAYEAMIDWPKRLANEGPFLRHWFETAKVRRVVDVACGAGQHAAMFRSWGLEVEGADLAPNMIERARTAFGEPPGLRWAVRSFAEPIETDEPFDAAVCLGNSLALAPDKAIARCAIECMLNATRPGGLLLVHLLNVWRLPDGPCVWQKCLRAALPRGDAMIVKGVHRSGCQAFVDMLVTTLSDPPRLQAESAPLLTFETGELEQLAQQAGASDIQLFGGYRDEPFAAESSVDMILVARK